MKQCPRCASEISAKDKVCPRCRLPVSKMVEAQESLAEELEKQAGSAKLNRAQKKEKRKLAKLAKKEAKKQRKIDNAESKTDFSQFAANRENVAEADEHPFRKRKNKDESFKFVVDENGEFNIDTKDVEIIGEEAAKIYEERMQKQTYSVKKARGDFRPPKIKWWEIYKLADRSFARRKIKKEVSKASKIKPDFISKGKLLTLAVFLGWCGAHNFYAKNKKKGFVTLGFLTVSFVSMLLRPFIQQFELWLIGFTGFVVMVVWISDVVDIIFNKFKYRIQRDKFIAGMNIETRAKLGEKYIDLELLKKPWWMRFKVWCEQKKSNYQEWRKERRQRLIEKEKAKLEKQEEKEKLETEIALAEQKELETIRRDKLEAKQENTKRPGRGSKNAQKSGEASEEKHKTSPKKRTAKVTINNKSKNNIKKK